MDIGRKIIGNLNVSMLIDAQINTVAISLTRKKIMAHSYKSH